MIVLIISWNILNWNLSGFWSLWVYCETTLKYLEGHLKCIVELWNVSRSTVCNFYKFWFACRCTIWNGWVVDFFCQCTIKLLKKWGLSQQICCTLLVFKRRWLSHEMRLSCFMTLNATFIYEDIYLIWVSCLKHDDHVVNFEMRSWFKKTWTRAWKIIVALKTCRRDSRLRRTQAS